MARRIEVYAASDDIWSLLPPHDELIQGCRVFLTTCLQVGKLQWKLTEGANSWSAHRLHARIHTKGVIPGANGDESGFSERLPSLEHAGDIGTLHSGVMRAIQRKQERVRVLFGYSAHHDR